MIICEIIGLYVAILLCLALITFLYSLSLSGSLDEIDAYSIAVSFCTIMAILLLLASILFVQFRHYPEHFGYTAIEEAEESEE